MRRVAADWASVILVCGKCSRRVDGGFGRKGRTPLAKLLRDAGNGRKGRKADHGVIETKCQKICPKKGVLAIEASRPRDWMIVPAGLGDAEVLALFGLD